MGIKTIVISDWSGDTLDADTKPTKLTIQAPGVTAKDATVVELYMSADEIDEFAKRLNEGTPIIPKSIAASKPASRSSVSSAASQVSDGKASAWDQFNELLQSEGGTAKALAEKINEWLAENPVAKERGDGNYKSFTATKPGIQPPILEAYLAREQ